MNRTVILGYQLLTGFSDACTGALLIVAPAFTLRIMGLHVPDDALLFISFVGAFVLSVGLSCLYGALVVARRGSPCVLETVWLLTALARGSVAIFLIAQILAHALEVGWLTVAATDGLCVLIQAVGLRKGWAAYASR
jgi:hypothetical protein